MENCQIEVTNISIVRVWSALSTLNQIFLAFLVIVFFYSSTGCLRTLVASLSQSQTSQQMLSRRLRNLRQLHFFSFLLFTLCVFVQIPDLFHTVDTSKAVPVESYTRTVTFLFSFDAKIAFAFLFLHALQWLASSRVESLASSMPHSLENSVDK